MALETSKVVSPAIVRSMSLDRGPHRSFLSDVVIDYGPRDVLGRLFLKADTELRKRGIFLSFAEFDELVAVNKANSDSWAPVVPLFDPAVADLSKTNSFAMVGRNSHGEPVCATAGRQYDLSGTTLKAEVESLRFFYRDPDAKRVDGETVEITAPAAATMSGRPAYVGATWYHPSMRGKGVMSVLSTLTRALPITRWQCDRVLTFMSRALITAGVAANCHCPNVEWDVTLTNTPVARGSVYRGALIWGDEDYLLQVLRDFTSSGRADAKVDGLVDDRTANEKRAV